MNVKKNEVIGPLKRKVSNYKEEPLKGNIKKEGKWYRYCKVCDKHTLIYNGRAKKNGKDGYAFVWDNRKINKETDIKGNFINTCKNCERARRLKIQALQ